MDDLTQILVYLGFLLIYLVSRALKNKKEKPATRLPQQDAARDFSDVETPERRPEVSQRQGRSGMDEPERRPSTFETWMRELTGADEWEEQVRQREEESRSAYERQRQKVQEKTEEMEQRVERKAAEYSGRLSDAVKQVKKAKRVHAKSTKELERLITPVKPKKKYRKTRKRTLGQEIARSLQDPQSARKAIILGEIMNRKYF